MNVPTGKFPMEVKRIVVGIGSIGWVTGLHPVHSPINIATINDWSDHHACEISSKDSSLIGKHTVIMFKNVHYSAWCPV